MSNKLIFKMQKKGMIRLAVINQKFSGNIIKNNVFENNYKGPKHYSPKEFFKVMLFNKKRNVLRKETKKLKVHNISKPINKNKDSITWLGHAGFLIILNKKRIIIDPVVEYSLLLRRRVEAPCKANTLGKIDYACISHNHWDHLNKPTLKRLEGNPTFLIPLKNKKFMPTNKVQEAGWFQQYNTEGVNIYLLPSYHWSSRWGIDRNKSLWGSFIIQTKKKTIYYSSDTGYSTHFKDIQKLFPNIDVCILPATSFEPTDLVAAEHMPIKQSLQAFKDLKGKQFVPFHYGTIDLGDNSTATTLKELETESKKAKISTILKLEIGKTHYF